MKCLFYILFFLSFVVCKAQYNDTLFIKLCESKHVIGDLIKKQHSVFDLKRHFKAKIDSIEYNFSNPNLLKRNKNLYLVSVGYSPSGMMLIALPAFVDSVPNKRFSWSEKQMHGCYSKINRTICEFDFDENGNIIGSSAMQGFGKCEDCMHQVFSSIPISIENMFIDKKPK
jgi:hypothetical protein